MTGIPRTEESVGGYMAGTETVGNKNPNQKLKDVGRERVVEKFGEERRC